MKNSILYIYPIFLVLLLLLASASFACAAESKIEFKVEVSGSGKPIILIPGLISSGEVWNETVAALSDYQTHVFTMPGFAGVPAIMNEERYLTAFKQGIVGYIEYNKLSDVTLIGHSMGGFLSLWIAADSHPAIEKIIVVDALPFLAAAWNPQAQTGFNEASAQQYLNSFLEMDEEDEYAGRLMMARTMTADQAKWEMLAKWALDSDLRTEAWVVTEMMGIDLQNEVGNIQVPVLVMGAYQENPQFPAYTLERMEQIYSGQYQQVSDLQLKIAENSGHFIMYDKPEWMIEKMRTFLSKQNQ
ncbi:alpha/beta hydrolase [Alkalimonas delamerensis]|uniref:Alpha/beta hydrolase n=1 Tax=Alkalimonas delamerensis TaxID=265981 RepID=A0ABT9GP12_9GAMM|nr:alpha/beta hydrolase [Alkalimonas delamerensis]MDP4528702.1 alpha/beta hydrolase [Alkalimonas delamerensis]